MLVSWILRDTLARCTQFFHLRVFGCAFFWCRDRDRLRMAFKVRTERPFEVGRVIARPSASPVPGAKTESSCVSKIKTRLGARLFTAFCLCRTHDREHYNLVGIVTLTGFGGRLCGGRDRRYEVATRPSPSPSAPRRDHQPRCAGIPRVQPEPAGC